MTELISMIDADGEIFEVQGHQVMELFLKGWTFKGSSVTLDTWKLQQAATLIEKVNKEVKDRKIMLIKLEMVKALNEHLYDWRHPDCDSEFELHEVNEIMKFMEQIVALK